LRLELDDEVRHCRAPFVFVGNNNYTLEGFNIGTRAKLDQGQLTVYTTRRSSAGGLARLALRALFGRLRQADDFMESSVRSLQVESRRRRLLVALDGEVHALETPLEFRILPRALQVIVP
ncbi:MAG TPA: sphingosine kinase, partial [Burkholderiales bacterium]|nr:sphingosine kinase [Burkholderiales bacterium]